MPEPKNAHGGKRAGAGRPTLYTEKMKERRVAMPDEMWELCKLVGGGNAGSGARTIIESWRVMFT